MYHLRNVWFGGIEKALTTYLTALLQDSLENIDSHLRVSTSMSALIRAFDKEFSLCANYPKGHGEEFKEWIKKNHPGELLLHVERASGSRQDLFVEGAPAVYWNRQYCIEFLDEQLRLPSKGNVLQENLFIVLSSLEMVGLSRILSILYLCIVIPVRWLSAKTHTLGKYNWGARSMGRVLDILEEKMDEIEQDHLLVLSKDYMMGLFSELMDELPPFREFWEHKFEKQQMSVVSQTNTKVVHMARLRDELFHPVIEDNQNSQGIVEDLVGIVTGAFLEELRNTNKASYKYLSSSGSPFSYNHCPEDIKNKMIGKMATNDLAESSFGGLTSQIQKYSRIGIPGAAAITDAKRNKFFDRRGKTGIFHNFPEGIRIALVKVAMEDAPRTRNANNLLLSKQREAKREKAEIAKRMILQKATETYIDAMYYHRMYRSDRCWKTIREVSNGIKSLQTKKDKYEMLKENISIRVKGFGWEQFRQAWSKDGKPHTIEFLADRLKDIIKKVGRWQKRQSWRERRTI